jgi:hypothetical protein
VDWGRGENESIFALIRRSFDLLLIARAVHLELHSMGMRCDRIAFPECEMGRVILPFFLIYFVSPSTPLRAHPLFSLPYHTPNSVSLTMFNPYFLPGKRSDHRAPLAMLFRSAIFYFGCI